MTLSRRATLMGLAGAASFGHVKVALADAPGQKRFIVVLQRGALDGLAAVVPYGDANLLSLRAPLVPPGPGAPGGVFDLGGFYGLSPNFPNLAALYQTGEALAVHAVAGPYRSRSHFHAQDMLQLGAAGDETNLTSGWLNRVLAELPERNRTSLRGLAAGLSTPLLLQGKMPVDGYAPEHLAEPPPDLLARIEALNAHDSLLGPAIADGIEAESFDKSVMGNPNGMAPPGMAAAGNAPKPHGFPVLAAQVAKLLAAEGGPRIAAFQMEGWDTHINQVGSLKAPMTGLDAGLLAMKTTLGPAWAQTCVLVVTEFGRTVRINGTKGTDHGTGAAAFALGGTVAGGRVLGTWPGLGAGQLFQNRDLAPTTDVRALAKGLVAQHLGLSAAAQARVFPSSGDAEAMGGLIRTV
jgi:uncharacterized protein (DUF1501 family)